MAGISDKLKNFLVEETDYDDEYVEEVEDNDSSLFEKNKSISKDSNLVLFEPRAYSEAQDIAHYLKEKKACVVNLHLVQKEQSKRIIDFLSGVIYAINGDIQQIGPRIFLCTPKNILVAGNISLDDKEENNA